MSDFVGRVAARALGVAPMIQPRMAGFFQPDPAPLLSLGETVETAPAPALPAEPQAGAFASSAPTTTQATAIGLRRLRETPHAGSRQTSTEDGATPPMPEASPGPPDGTQNPRITSSAAARAPASIQRRFLSQPPAAAEVALAAPPDPVSLPQAAAQAAHAPGLGDQRVPATPAQAEGHAEISPDARQRPVAAGSVTRGTIAAGPVAQNLAAAEDAIPVVAQRSSTHPPGAPVPAQADGTPGRQAASPDVVIEIGSIEFRAPPAEAAAAAPAPAPRRAAAVSLDDYLARRARR